MTYSCTINNTYIDRQRNLMPTPWSITDQFQDLSFGKNFIMSLEKKLHMTNFGSKLPPMPPPGVPFQKHRGPAGRKKDCSQLPWSDYFDSFEDVSINDDKFRVYRCGCEGPVLLMLHGGGFSALSWAVLAKAITKLTRCQVIALDMRGHGDTVTKDDDDMSEERMSNDVGNIVSTLFEDSDEAPPIILIGHSMGGAIAVHTAKRDLIPSLVALVVLDVVEGSALDALQSMQSFLRGRPKDFKSLEYAIDWVTRASQIRSLESARVSMIGQLRRTEHNCNDSESSSRTTGDVIIEEEEETNDAESSKHEQNSTQSSEERYTWRIDLSKTEKFWQGWFRGMSQLFLSCTVPKMLLLAGVDRLDKDLAIGQMQGKFQMVVVANCGHALHEDQPHKVAEALATFLIRNKFTEALFGFKRPYPSC